MMSINKKTVLSLLICLLAGMLLFGCGSRDKDPSKESVTSKSSQEFCLYYLNKTENGLKEVPYKLEHMNDPIGAVNEILHRLSDTTDNNTDQYKPSIYQGVIIRSATLKKKTVTIDFENNYQQLSSDKEILLRASIVKSLIQIEGIDSVVFTVGGSGLTGTDDKAIGAMTDNNFVLKREDLYTQKEKVTLYYANEKGNRLVEVERKIEVKNNMPIELGILNELIKKSGPSGTKKPLPHDLVIYSAQVYNSICYVDLSKEIEDIMPEVDDRIKIYSMVNSIVARGNVSQVQFTVEGKPVEEFNDFSDFDEPMSCDYSLAGKRKKK